MQNFKKFSSFIVLIATTNASHATLVNYSEAVSGDLSDSPTDPTFVINMAGTHTWSGSTFLDVVTDPVTQTTVFADFDLDKFGLQVTSGFQIEAVSQTVSNVNYSISSGTNFSLGAILRIEDSDGRIVYRELDNIVDGVSGFPLSELPLSAGQYAVVASVGSVSCPLECDSSWDWTVSIQVIPIPAALPLLGSALVGLGFLIAGRSFAS